MKFERRLVAFVVRPERPIMRVELGPLEPIWAAIDAWRPILRCEQPARPGRARRPGGAAAAAGLEPRGRAPGGGSDGVGLARRAAGAGAAGGAVGPGGGLLPDRGVHDRLGPRAPDVRRRRDGRGGRSEAGSGSGRGAVAAAGRRRRLRRRPRRGSRPGASRAAAVSSRAGLLPDFPKLPATGDEIASIGRYFTLHFRGVQPDELSGELATEAALREAASKNRFLHLATHGYFAPRT